MSVLVVDGAGKHNDRDTIDQQQAAPSNGGRQQATATSGGGYDGGGLDQLDSSEPQRARQDAICWRWPNARPVTG